MHQTCSCKLSFNYTTNIITRRFSMAGSKEHLRCINAEILIVISQMGKIFACFVVPNVAIGKIFNMLNVRKAGLRKTQVFLKKQPTCFFLNPFYRFFEKKQDFVLFLKKTEKAHSELFLFHHAIPLFSELHNNNLLYLHWHSKLRVKQCTPSLILQCVVGQFTPKIGKYAHSKQRATPTQTLQFHVKFTCMPC